MDFLKKLFNEELLNKLVGFLGSAGAKIIISVIILVIGFKVIKTLVK